MENFEFPSIVELNKIVAQSLNREEIQEGLNVFLKALTDTPTKNFHFKVIDADYYKNVNRKRIDDQIENWDKIWNGRLKNLDAYAAYAANSGDPFLESFALSALVFVRDAKRFDYVHIANNGKAIDVCNYDDPSTHYLIITKPLAYALMQAKDFLVSQGYTLRFRETDRALMQLEPKDVEPVAFAVEIANFVFDYNFSEFSANLDEFIEANGFDATFKFNEIERL